MLRRADRFRPLTVSLALAAAVLVGGVGAAEQDAEAAPGGTASASATAHGHPAGSHALETSEVAGAAGPAAAGRSTKRKKRLRSAQRRTTRAVALTRPAVRPAAAGFAFSTVLDGQPVRWDPCAPIRWTANLVSAPQGGLGVLHESVARIAQLTGTTWEYVGESAATPTSGYLPTRAQDDYAPVLLGWTDAAGSDLLAGQPREVLGMTRTAWFGIQRSDGTKVAAIRTAAVALDRTDSLPLRGRGSWKALVLHELGHVMGLAHTDDRSQLMASVLPAAADLQAGDVAGLGRVGHRNGCVVVR